jgi:glycosyltransferase involved in cell wall biosynthesis
MNPNGWRKSTVYGGAEKNMLLLAEKLKIINWKIVMIDQLFNKIKNRPQHIEYFLLKKPFETNSNPVYDIFLGLLFLWKTILVGIKNKHEYSVVYASTTNFSDIFPAYLISIICKKKLVTKYQISIYEGKSLSEIYKVYRLEKNGLFDSMLRSLLAKTTLLILNRCDLIICISNYLKTQLELCGISKELIKVNYYGIDFDELKKYKKDHKKVYDFCYIGRIEKNKGVDDLMKFTLDLKKDTPSINGIIIGDGTYIEEIKTMSTKYGLDKNITFTGFLDEKRYEYLQRSKVFINPTRAKEGFGLTLLEASYFQLPVICYKNPILEEVYDGFKNIIFIDDYKYIKPTYELLSSTKTNIIDDKLLKKYDFKEYAQRETELLLPFWA